MVFAALAGAATIATFAVTIVMGQEFLPGRIGVAAGVTIGLSIGHGRRRARRCWASSPTPTGCARCSSSIVFFPLAALALSLALPVRRDPGARAAPRKTQTQRSRA